MTQSNTVKEDKFPDSENESDAEDTSISEDANENSDDDKALDSDEEVNTKNLSFRPQILF